MFAIAESISLWSKIDSFAKTRCSIMLQKQSSNAFKEGFLIVKERSPSFGIDSIKLIFYTILLRSFCKKGCLVFEVVYIS